MGAQSSAFTTVLETAVGGIANGVAVILRICDAFRSPRTRRTAATAHAAPAVVRRERNRRIATMAQITRAAVVRATMIVAVATPITLSRAKTATSSRIRPTLNTAVLMRDLILVVGRVGLATSCIGGCFLRLEQ